MSPYDRDESPGHRAMRLGQRSGFDGMMADLINEALGPVGTVQEEVTLLGEAKMLKAREHRAFWGNPCAGCGRALSIAGRCVLDHHVQ